MKVNSDPVLAVFSFKNQDIISTCSLHLAVTLGVHATVFEDTFSA